MNRTTISRLARWRLTPLMVGTAAALVVWLSLLAGGWAHGRSSILPGAELAAGLLLGGLLAWVMYLFQKARARTRGIQEAHERIRRAEQRLRSTVESAPVGMVMVDRHGRVVLVNAEAEKLFGYRREELLGEPVEILVPAPSRDAHQGYRAEFLAAPQSRRMGAGRDLFAVRKDGSEFPVEIGLNPIETDDGPCVLAVVADISERKRIEREVHDLNERLEQRVAERTAQAEAASRAKSAFLANMSHEIRTPLNAVIGMTGLALETGLNAEQREYLELVRESGESLLQVINDILDFSKIEAGRIELDRVVFHHGDMLGNTMKLLGLRAHGKGLELLHRVAPNVPPVLVGDPGRLRQVIVNLVGNAIKFTDSGEVVVNVELASSHDGQAELHYTVTDTGVGIPPEKLADVFEAFEQVETTTTRRFGGTGLGLAICRRLVELMGGRIWVESEVGRGTTFHFTARLGVSEHPPAEPATPETVHGMPVLVVDDNATGRRILGEMLRKWSMEPRETADGAEALAALREAADSDRPFRLLLTDAHMPGVDGFALTEQIVDDPTLARPTIIMLSSGDRPGELERCDRLGVAAHLIKPVKPSELFDAIMVALRITAPEEAREAPAAAAWRLPPLRVLLAEDSPINQRLAKVLLEKQGHQVEIAAHGREAIDKLKSDRFDLVLMDVQMPEMDGLDATKIIRARERLSGRHLPIVALTAHAMKGDQQRCLDAGMDGYVPKPLRADTLFSAMSTALQDARLQDRGASHAAPTGRETRSPPAARIPLGQDGPIDWSIALERAYHDDQLLLDLAQMLLDEMPRRLAEIDDAFARGDAAAAERAAHTLKGQLRVFGAHAAADYALQVEMHARDGDLTAKDLRASLKREAQRVRRALLELTGAEGR